MFKKYLKITLKNLLKNKTYSFTSILRLAIGMASCIFGITSSILRIIKKIRMVFIQEIFQSCES